MVILDIGCGYKPNGDVNLDINGSTIVSQKIRNKSEKTFIIADAKTLPFKNGTFQKVFIAHLIEHFTIEDGPELVSEWFRVLEKEGSLS